MVRHYVHGPAPLDRCGSINELGQRCNLDTGHRESVGSPHVTLNGETVVQWDEYGIFGRAAYIGVGVTEAQAMADIRADRFDDGSRDHE